MEATWKEIVADWQGETTFIGYNHKGGSVQMGTLGNKLGVGPMELLLAALAGCTGMDIANVLAKKRQTLVDLKLVVRGKQSDVHPKIYTEISVEYLLWGKNLDPKAVEQAIQLSEEKYCSVGAMLGAVAPITTTYRILAPGEEYIEKQETIS